MTLLQHEHENVTCQFALHQTLSRLFHLFELVKSWQFFLQLNSKRPYNEVQKKKKKVVVLCLHPPETWNFAFSRRSRAVTGKKCTKKRDERPVFHSVVILSIQTYCFFASFSLTRSPSSLLQLPFNHDLPNISSSEAVDQEASATILWITCKRLLCSKLLYNYAWLTLKQVLMLIL